MFAGDLLRQLKSYWWLFALGILLATPWPRRFYEKYRATPLVWLPLFAVFWLCLYLIATARQPVPLRPLLNFSEGGLFHVPLFSPAVAVRG